MVIFFLKKCYLKLQVQPWQNTSTIEDFQEKFNKFYNDPRHSNIRTITPNDMIIDKYYAGKYQRFLIFFFREFNFTNFFLIFQVQENHFMNLLRLKVNAFWMNEKLNYEKGCKDLKKEK